MQIFLKEENKIWQPKWRITGNDFVWKLCIAISAMQEKNLRSKIIFCIAICEFCIANLKYLKLQNVIIVCRFHQKKSASLVSGNWALFWQNCSQSSVHFISLHCLYRSLKQMQYRKTNYRLERVRVLFKVNFECILWCDQAWFWLLKVRGSPWLKVRSWILCVPKWV